jgi:hypothetical protein
MLPAFRLLQSVVVSGGIDLGGATPSRLPEDIWGMGRSGRSYAFQRGEAVSSRGVNDLHLDFHGPIYADERAFGRTVVDSLRATASC